ncbi:hypothetical protein GEMRC1_007365 [Eukaryota sp. GEM-RC1]
MSDLSQYLKDHNVYSLFKEITSTLLAQKSDPIEVIVDLLENNIPVDRTPLPADVTSYLDRLFMFALDDDRWQVTQAISFFSFLDPVQRQEIALSMQFEAVSSNEIILTENDSEAEPPFYIIDSGTVEFFTSTDQGRQFCGFATKYDYFGELASFTEPPSPRRATAVAKDEVCLWKLDYHLFKSTLLPIMKSKRDQISPLLSHIPLFSSLTAYEFALIADSATLSTFDVGYDIVEQGSPGNAFHVIVRGEAIVTKLIGEEPQRVGSLHSGDFFGELALLLQHPRFATVTATSPCTIASLSDLQFRKLVKRTNCGARIKERMLEYTLDDFPVEQLKQVEL